MDKIPLCKVSIADSEINLVTEVLKSGWLTHGPKNTEFENSFAEYIGVKHAISVNSCTSALFLALIANEIKGEVILPSFTFVASANAVVTAGATPVFADIEYDTCNIDPADIKKKITANTKAIMVVHYAGQCCNMPEIKQIAKEYNLFLIEDSAETIGGECKGKKSGSWGMGCFSFFPTKNITTGEGGMFTTNEDNLAQKVRGLIGHGILKSTSQRQVLDRPWYREAAYAGYNFRMSNLLAAIGVEQMKKLDSMNEARRKNSQMLKGFLSDIPNIDLPVERQDCKHVYQMFAIKVKGINRDETVIKLKSKGLDASVHFDPPVHKQAAYRNYATGHLKITEDVARTTITLPMFPDLTQEQVHFIAETVRKCV